MTTHLDISTRGKLAALKRRVAEAAEVSRPLLLSAPDDRPATDNPIGDPTADIVLHPARIAVAEAHRDLVNLHKAITYVEAAEAVLANLADAVAAWYGDKRAEDDDA